ncbi:MAG: hypothetical protein AB1746_03350 [Candidatus Zixiibacteriota bacterium]
MRLILSLIFIGLFFVGSSAVGDMYSNPMLRCSFELPSEWTAQQAAPDILTINADLGDSVEITISVFELDPDSPITSDKALTMAIAGLYNDIGIKSANPDMIEYTVDGGVASFQAEYNRLIEGSEAVIRTGLKGVIGRLTSGDQVLYLIVVMAPSEMFESIRSRTEILMSSFRIDETLAEDFFPRRNLSPYIIMLVVVALTIFFFMRNRRVQKSRNPLGRDSGSFWRCSLCGRVNHMDNETCGRCGNIRAAADKVTKY